MAPAATPSSGVVVLTSAPSRPCPATDTDTPDKDRMAPPFECMTGLPVATPPTHSCNSRDSPPVPMTSTVSDGTGNFSSYIAAPPSALTDMYTSRDVQKHSRTSPDVHKEIMRTSWKV